MNKKRLSLFLSLFLIIPIGLVLTKEKNVYEEVIHKVDFPEPASPRLLEESADAIFIALPTKKWDARSPILAKKEDGSIEYFRTRTEMYVMDVIKSDEGKTVKRNQMIYMNELYALDGQTLHLSKNVRPMEAYRPYFIFATKTDTGEWILSSVEHGAYNVKTLTKKEPENAFEVYVKEKYRNVMTKSLLKLPKRMCYEGKPLKRNDERKCERR